MRMTAFWAPLGFLLASICLPVQARSYALQKHGWYKDYYPDKLDYCFIACRTAVRDITFQHPDFTEDASFYEKELTNTLKIKSIYYCAQAYCTPDEAEHGRDYVSRDFETNAGEALPPLAQYRLASEDLARVDIMAQEDANATSLEPLNHPVVPAAQWHALAERTIRAMYNTWDLGFHYTFVLTGFSVAVLSIGLVGRASYFLPRLVRRASESKVWTYFRRFVLLPAAFDEKQAVSIRQTFTIPPRLESLTLVMYAAINVYMCLPGYELFAGNLYWDRVNLQLARYVSDRMGFLSIAQLPMIWVFAARNNLLLWLTGWPYATYNRFHRWIATISVALAIGHSIGYSIMELMRGREYYLQDWLQEYWYMGGIATVVMSLMLPLSAFYLRHNMYDLFLAGHIILSVVFFIALWYHVRIFDGEFNYYLYPCIVIWLLDRLLRVKRLLSGSFALFSRGVRATASYHSESDVVRLDVTEMLSYQQEIVPGHYYFLYLPAGLRGYESHPFTLCSWRRSEGVTLHGATEPSSSSHDNIQKKTDIDDDNEESRVGLLAQDRSDSKIAHSFLIRPYGGMTKRLKERVISGGQLGLDVTAPRQMTVLLEGPYGDNLNLSGYSDVLFICGGAGVATAISHSHFLQDKATKVHIAWAVQQQHLPDDICTNELKSVLEDGTVDLTVYLTGSRNSPEESKEIEMENLTSNDAEPPYEVRLGRPDIEAVMRQYRKRASESLAIVTTGTAQMSDACRKAVAIVLGEPGVHIGYYNQTLMW